MMPRAGGVGSRFYSLTSYASSPRLRGASRGFDLGFIGLRLSVAVAIVGRYVCARLRICDWSSEEAAVAVIQIGVMAFI